MGNTNDVNYWNEIKEGVMKALIYIAFIIPAILAKLALDSRTRELTKKQRIVKIIIASFSGFLASMGCEYWGVQRYLAGMIVPVVTLLGESIMDYLIKNWPVILKRFTGINVTVPNPKKN